MHEIDASFRLNKEKARKRRRTRSLRRIVVALAVVAALGLAGVGAWMLLSHAPSPGGATVERASPEAAAEPEIVFVPAIVDLAGDPLIISIGGDAGGAPKLKEIARPAELMQPGISPTIAILSDTMVSSSERFMTTLPSSPEDFAFFQAQSGRSRPSPDAISAAVVVEEAPADAGLPEEEEFSAEPDDGLVLVPVESQNDGGTGAEPLPPEGEAVPDEPTPLPAEPPPAPAQEPGADLAAGWGETVSDGQMELPDYARTRIEDTTSIGEVVPEIDRFPATEDVLVRVLGERTLDSVLLEHRFEAEDARRAGEALQSVLDLEALEPGHVVAMRGTRSDQRQAALKLAQVSIYSSEAYVGTLALSDTGEFEAGADPWVEDELFGYSEETPQDAPKRQYRLLDALYSTAARNNVPTAVIGEAIMLMSRSFDLDVFATQEDRLVVLFSKSARDGDAGKVLYVAIEGPGKEFRCFVFQVRPGADFSCMSDKDQTREITVTDGMVTPVTGVMTSGFGPRRHPILKQVRIHKGVDWAAPIGTPVMAAFDGTVHFAGDNSGYGNFVRLEHGSGRATGYAHLDRFAAGLAKGQAVKAGDVIGYVGTTGLSTGPHLHFELYRGGEAVDPLASAVAAVSDGSAVDALVNRIVRVESAGNPNAKNPLSTATGLGQFIDSTWLRMMRTYRPELARSLSRADLLALRFDPTISREMVANLARENEAHLRARGHGITAGRLYLAHFLGPEGANIVLSAAPEASLAELLGNAVISANPFLTGKDAAYVVGWAETKMRGKGRSPAPRSEKRVVKLSEEFVGYREAIARLVASVETAL